MAKDKSSFVFHIDWLKAFEKLSGDECKELLICIAKYAVYGEESNSLQGMASMAYTMMQSTIDRDMENWKKTCEKRAQAGEKGGIAKASKSSKAKQDLANVANASKSSKSWQSVANLANAKNSSKPSKAWQSVANVADSDNDYDCDYDCEIEGDNPPKSPLTTPKMEKPAGEGESLSVEMATGAEKASPSKTLIRQRFDQFWAEYPRKAGKSDAAKVWKAIDPDEALFAEIMDGLKRAKQSAQWLDNGGKYIPNPANWLSKRRWEDQDPVPAESVRGGSRSYDIGAFEAMVEMGGIIPPMEGTAWEIE